MKPVAGISIICSILRPAELCSQNFGPSTPSRNNENKKHLSFAEHSTHIYTYEVVIRFLLENMIDMLYRKDCLDIYQLRYIENTTNSKSLPNIDKISYSSPSEKWYCLEQCGLTYEMLRMKIGWGNLTLINVT